MRGLSEAADKMNTIPRLLPLMNCGKICMEEDATCHIPVRVFCGDAVLEMFVIVINILSGSGGVSDTQAWKGLIKRSYCRRSPDRDTTP